MTRSEIESAFGGDFYSKYLEALRKNRDDRYKITDNMKKEIVKQCLERLSPESASFSTLIGGSIHHVILAETSSNLDIKEWEDRCSVSMRWIGKLVRVSVKKEDMDKIAPNNAYLVIGYIRERENQGRKFLNMIARAILTMDEVEKLRKEL